MKAMLRNLAANWADKRFVKANDVLRHELIRVRAANDRLRQEKARLQNALRSYGQLAQANAQMRRQAEQDRDAALTQMHAMEAERDQAWEALNAAGLPRAEARQP